MTEKEAFLAELEKLSKAETLGDEIRKGENVCVDDYAGGNIDDAYDKGYGDGQTHLARLVLKFLVD